MGPARRPPSARPRDREARRKGHLNPGAAGGARPGQSRRRSDPRSSAAASPSKPEERQPSGIKMYFPPSNGRGGGWGGGGRGERKTSERQTRGERRESAERGPAAVSAPAGIVCAARAPSPAPHGPATDTLRRSPAVSPRLCPHSPPKTGEQPSRTCSPEEGRGIERAGGTRHPPRGPRGGARPADSFPPRAGPSGETGGGEERGNMGAFG